MTQEVQNDGLCKDASSYSNELPDCSEPAEYHIDTVLTALGHTDVQAALSAGGLYGADLRLLDAPLLRVETGGQSLDVGSPCMGTTSCVPIPEGVAELAVILRGVAVQQRCSP